MEEKSFFIVCNFESSHWLMSNAKKFETEQDAVKYADYLAGKYRNDYHVLKTTKLVRIKTPTEVIDL